MIQVDLYTDMVCPWCRLGKRHLEQAIDRWNETEEAPVEVTYKAYMLNASLPAEGVPFRAYFERMGALDRIEESQKHLCRLGEQCGLEFHFERVDKMPNTRLAHRLIKLLPKERQLDLFDALAEAYFVHGQDVGSPDVLLEVAASRGHNREELQRRLDAGEGEAEVEADVAFAGRSGIQGVPFFVLNGKYGVSGAQPVEAFLDAFRQLRDEAGQGA